MVPIPGKIGVRGEFDLRAVAEKVRALKKKGKRVALCHGVFDLLHVGHLRHFREAKAMGDVLVVTLTPDRFVRKGPHRPAFPERLRAELLAGLKVADFVAVNEWPTAIETIKLLKPDFYVKGADYKIAKKDLTGMIAREDEAVRSVGGRLRITEEITFSSTRLLNRHVPLYDPEVKDYLKRLSGAHSIKAIHDSLDSLRGLKVLVVGEAILDEYVYCDALGKSSKEPILAMQFVSKEVHAGGSLAIANHAAEFAGRVDLIAYAGSRASQRAFMRRSLKENVEPFFIKKPDSPTIVKRRFVERYQVTKMLEVYEMNDAPLAGPEEAELLRFLKSRLRGYDAVIVADYGHGLITQKAAQLLSSRARFLAVNTQLNAANIGFHTISRYPRADFICIHEGELRLDYRSRQGDLRGMMESLAKRSRCPKVMVTRGKNGTLLFEKGKGFSETPSFAIRIVDRVGAGDAVLAVSSLAVAGGMPGDAAGFVSNLAGAQAVLTVGNRSSIDGVGIKKTVESLLK